MPQEEKLEPQGGKPRVNEGENPPKTKGRNPRVSKGVKDTAPVSKIEELPQCHIHDKVPDWEVYEIRENVCVNDKPLTEFEGNYYCLFHLPTKEKDIFKFEEKFRARLKEVEDRSAAIEELAEEERKEAKSELFYDFRYVWFPSIVVFDKYKFSAGAYFSYATFSDDAFFSKATFSAEADFWSTTFTAHAYFNWANFMADADFAGTKFGKEGMTSFYKVNFAKDTFFNETEFNNDVIFNSAICGEDSDVFFRRTFFAKNVDFQYCTSEGYLRFSNLRLGEDCKFDFEEAAFEKASRVSFHTVWLYPNWFVNVDARKFVFTDIEWRNLDSDRRNKNIGDELDCLEERGIDEQKKRLLEVACRQLAVNAEENNRYEEAAKFRYMAMETRRLEELKQRSFSRYLIWLYKWTSGYGESWSWAALMLFGVLILSGLLYAAPFSEFDYGEKTDEQVLVEKESDLTKKYDARFHAMNVDEGLVHSLYVAALQRPEPKPAPDSDLTKLFVILETIFAPLQAALLALAIRRKFMR